MIVTETRLIFPFVSNSTTTKKHCKLWMANTSNSFSPTKPQSFSASMVYREKILYSCEFKHFSENSEKQFPSKCLIIFSSFFFFFGAGTNVSFQNLSISLKQIIFKDFEILRSFFRESRSQHGKVLNRWPIHGIRIIENKLSKNRFPTIQKRNLPFHGGPTGLKFSTAAKGSRGTFSISFCSWTSSDNDDTGTVVFLHKI